jgi:alanyl-tRNA synthetase
VFVHHTEGEKLSCVLRRPKNDTVTDCSAILKEAFQLIEGKGGGKSDNAQGSGNAKNKIQFISKILDLVNK